MGVTLEEQHVLVTLGLQERPSWSNVTTWFVVCGSNSTLLDKMYNTIQHV